MPAIRPELSPTEAGPAPGSNLEKTEPAAMDGAEGRLASIRIRRRWGWRITGKEKPRRRPNGNAGVEKHREGRFGRIAPPDEKGGYCSSFVPKPPIRLWVTSSFVSSAVPMSSVPLTPKVPITEVG